MQITQREKWLDTEENMREYSVWVDAAEKIASFHAVANSNPVYFEQHEDFLDYLGTLTTQGYRFQ